MTLLKELEGNSLRKTAFHSEAEWAQTWVEAYLELVILTQREKNEGLDDGSDATISDLRTRLAPPLEVVIDEIESLRREHKELKLGDKKTATEVDIGHQGGTTEFDHSEVVRQQLSSIDLQIHNLMLGSAYEGIPRSEVNEYLWEARYNLPIDVNKYKHIFEHRVDYERQLQKLIEKRPPDSIDKTGRVIGKGYYWGSEIHRDKIMFEILEQIGV